MGQQLSRVWGWGVFKSMGSIPLNLEVQILLVSHGPFQAEANRFEWDFFLWLFAVGPPNSPMSFWLLFSSGKACRLHGLWWFEYAGL